jgi:hypothetical protein
MFEDPLCSPLASMAWTLPVRADASVLHPGNFITDATVRPSHGRPCGHCSTVRPSVIVRVTTLPPSDRKKIKIKKIIFFGSCCWLEKRGKNISVFGFQSPRSPSSTGKAARRRFFRPSSPSHPSKLYSSLGWLNSKVPKPFFPFTLRLIDVDGF